MKLKSKIFFICCLLNFAFLTKAQVNLVLNPSFEKYKYCPNLSANNVDDSFVAWNWNQYDSTKRGTCIPELCLTCTPQYKCSIPYNIYSGDFQFARTGNNMMHVLCYNANTSFYYQRDYLHGHLQSKLQNSKQYCVTCYINLENSMGTAINHFGMYLDAGLLDTMVPCNNFTVTPQIDNTGGLLSDTLNWMKVQGVYAANGTETNITLGNFKSDAGSGATIVNSSAFAYAYYFVDDISIIPTDLPAYAGHDTLIHLNDSAYIGRPSEIGLNDDCIWYVAGNITPIDTIAGLWVKPNTLGVHSYVVEQNICGTITYDTVKVTVNPVGIEQFSNNLQVNIYPNPTSEILNVELGIINETAEVKITNVLGEEVINYKLGVISGNSQIDVSGLQNGIYFVSIKTPQGFVTKKVVVQH
jgi:hypothetical protein